MANPITSLDARQSLSEIRNNYSTRKGLFRGMIIGEKGIGKTTLLETCPKPILHLCFDPDGEQVLQEVEIIKTPGGTSERVSKNPDWLYPITSYQANDVAAYDKFEADFRTWQAQNIFQDFGTVCLDSLTTFGDTIVAKVLNAAMKAKPAHLDILEIQDYMTVADKAQYWIKTFLNLPTNVVILGHIQEDTDEITHRTIYNVMFPGQKTSQRVPIFTSEIYYMLQEEGGIDPKTRQPLPGKRYLLTQNNGKYKASTRLGAKERFKIQEPADIKSLMLKAGLDIQNKPNDIFTADAEPEGA